MDVNPTLQKIMNGVIQTKENDNTHKILWRKEYTITDLMNRI